jgi:hypothetical protein
VVRNICSFGKDSFTISSPIYIGNFNINLEKPKDLIDLDETNSKSNSKKMTIYLGIPAPNYSFTQAIMYGFGMCGNGRMSIK